MKRSMVWLPFAFSTLCLVGTGCARPSVSVEVLPPRTSATCAAASTAAVALGQGLLDVAATLGAHGSYVADLRFSLPGSDASVDGVKLSYKLPEGSSVDAGDYDGEFVMGNALLSGEKDDLRTAVVENVALVARPLAKALQADSDLDLGKLDRETMEITITPVVDEAVADVAPTTFALALCAGCLVTPPDGCSAPGEFNVTPVVCRVGQDIPVYSCNPSVVVP
jgi:hypothetical protein